GQATCRDPPGPAHRGEAAARSSAAYGPGAPTGSPASRNTNSTRTGTPYRVRPALGDRPAASARTPHRAGYRGCFGGVRTLAKLSRFRSLAELLQNKGERGTLAENCSGSDRFPVIL